MPDARLPTIPKERFDLLLHEGAELWQRYHARRGGDFHGFVPADYAGAYRHLQQLRPRADSFLELGSGAGVITILADLLGYEAYGIEIEPWLVESAGDLAERHASAARFVTGSFVPEDLRERLDLLDADFHVTLEGEPAYIELGLDLDDFDLVYAFPWPGEERLFHEIVRTGGRNDTLFLSYSASDGFALTSPTRRA